MNTTFRTLLFTATLMILPILAIAQPGQRQQVDPDEYAKNMITQLSEKVELSDGQKDSLTVVFKSFMETQRAAMANRDREKMMAATEKRDKEAEAIIRDKDKIKAYKKFLEERAPRPRGQRGNG
jgi:hypothetical protein